LFSLGGIVDKSDLEVVKSKEKIVEYRMITSDQYNQIDLRTRRTLKNVLVKYSDEKVYQVEKGKLIRMLHPPVLDPNRQTTLAQRYRNQQLSEIKNSQKSDDFEGDDLLA
jgi:hypothetical protein